MKMNSIVICPNLRICLLSLFVGIMLSFSLLPLLHGGCYAAEKESDLMNFDSSLYQVEDDALKLNGTLVRVRDWTSKDGAWVNADYFEPLVLTINVNNRGGECFGEKDFYLRNGLDAKQLKVGDKILFYINKNMCHPNQALIIMNLQVVK